MKVTPSIALVALVAVLLACPGHAAAQLVTIRFDANAPVSPLGTEAEYQTVVRIQQEQDPNVRLRLINEFLSGEYRNELVDVGGGEDQLGGFDIDAPFNTPIERPRAVESADTDRPTTGSEFTYLVLGMRFQTLRQQGADPEDIIEAAEGALASHEHFFDSKMGFITDPDNVPQVAAFRLDWANQRSIFYQAMMEAYQQMEDADNVLRYGEMALDAEDETWTLYNEQFDRTATGFPVERDRHLARQTVLLGTMMGTYEFLGNVENEIAYARRFLEVQPDDRVVLTRVSQYMATPANIPADGPDRDAHLEAAVNYAGRAVDAVDAYLAGPESADLDDLEKAAMASQANAALGMVRFQNGEFADAAAAYNRAAEAVPEAQLYFLLGVAHTNAQNVDEAVSTLAQAVYLEFPQPQTRQILKVAYKVQNGSLDRLNKAIEHEEKLLNASQ